MAVEPVVVLVERDIEDLIPLFLAQRRADQAVIAAALALSDFDAIRKVAHGMVGAGASYGFTHVSALGERLLEAACACDAAALARVQREFEDYLARLVVKYR